MVRDICRRALIIGPFLHVFGNRNVRHGPARKRGFDGHIDDIQDMRRPIDLFVVSRHVDKRFIEIDILLIVRADQVMVGMAGNGEHRLAIAFSIVQPIDQMQATGTRGGQADSQAMSELGIGAGRECRRLFVPDLYECNTVLAGSQGFKESVDTVAGIAKDCIDAPGDQSLNERIGYRLSYGFSPFPRARVCLRFRLTGMTQSFPVGLDAND